MHLSHEQFFKDRQKYESIARNTKNHHWVPQFYLRYFSIPENNDQVFMYTSDGKKVKVNVGGVSASKDLYTFEDSDGGKTKAMEGIFSEHEGVVAPVLEQVIKNEVLPEGEADRAHVAAFVSLLRVRGPSFSDWLKNMEVEHIKLFNQIKAEHSNSLRDQFKKAGITFSSEHEFEELREFMQDPERYNIEMEGGEEHYFKQAMELGKELYDILMTQKSWHLLVAPARRHFITSDNPVVIQEPNDCPPHVASGFLNGTALLTISPKLCIAFRRFPLKSKKIQLYREDVNHINKSIANVARKQVYSNLDSNDIKSLSQKYLNGNESRVALRRLVPYAPYYMSSSIPQFKESETLAYNSISV